MTWGSPLLGNLHIIAIDGDMMVYIYNDIYIMLYIYIYIMLYIYNVIHIYNVIYI